MDRKKFIIFLVALTIIFIVTVTIENYTPEQTGEINIDSFPLVKNGWIGEKTSIDQAAFDLLNPDKYFSAVYTNQDGVVIQLFFDYFSAQNRIGGPHSPRNCLPGSGWSIMDQTDFTLNLKNRSINMARFNIVYKNRSSLMDFWYITKYGETANDYVYKFYLMLSSLTLQPTDRAFVRIICNSSDKEVEAMKHFEETFVEDIYSCLRII